MQQVGGRHLSVSSVKLADKCSLAHHLRYVDQMPAPEEAASMVFGTVVHNGVELWYDKPGSNNHLKTHISEYVHSQWFERLPQDVAIELRHCLQAEQQLVTLAQVIQMGRPELKAPRTTKAFLTSEQFMQFEDARTAMMAVCKKCEDMRWPQDENPFQAYQRSMVIANRLEARWKRHPRPIVVEQEFLVEVAGFEVKGRIDQIRADPDPHGEVKLEGLDLKTGRQKMTQMEAFLQAYIYNEACYQDDSLPIPAFWTFFMARLDKPQHGHIDRERHGKIAGRILNRVRKQIESGEYAPHYGMWCNHCDYRDLCEQEISMWPPGEDTMVLGAEAEPVATVIGVTA